MSRSANKSFERRVWPRRIAIAVLSVTVTGLLGVVGLCGWAVAVTVPVVVVDANGRPIGDVAVFDLEKAMRVEESGCAFSRPFGRAAVCLGGGGGGLPCVPLQPAANSPAAASGAANNSSSALSCGFGCGGWGGVTSGPPSRRSTVLSEREPLRAKLTSWLHDVTRSFGVAMVWDQGRPVYTGGNGRVRVPESRLVTAISLGDLKVRPGEVYAVEAAPASREVGASPARIVIRRVSPAPAALERRVSWKFTEIPLGDFFKTVESESGLAVRAEWIALEEEGVTRDTAITIDLEHAALRLALDLVLGQVNLTYLCDEGSIFVTSQINAGNRLKTRLYPVQDLLPGRGEELEEYADELAGIVRGCVSPNSWDAVGGAGDLFVFTAERTLIVSQTRAVHNQIAELLDALRRGDGPPESEADRQLREALERPVSLEFHELPLGDVVTSIRGLIDHDVVLDRIALEEEGVTSATPVSLRVVDLPLRHALRLLLSQLNLTTVTRDGVLVITSQINACNALVQHVYAVADLVGDPPDPDTLRNVIQQTVWPSSWSTVGGQGDIHFFTPRQCLVLTQTEAMQEQVASLLKGLRTGKDEWEPEPNRAIRRSLTRRVSCDLTGVPLADAVRRITAGEIENVAIDRVSLEDEGVPEGTAVSFRVSNMTMACALRHLLGPLKLAAVVRDGALVVTSRLEAENRLEKTWLYPVADLLGDPPDPDSLRELILRAVSPNHWDSVGGAGAVEYFPPRQCLVVLQSAEIHDALAALLAQLRGKPTTGMYMESTIREVLRDMAKWTIVGTPLRELCRCLRDTIGCNVLLDEIDLRAEGIDTSQAISIVADSEPLGLALGRGLELIDAGYTVRDEAVLISSLASGQTDLAARVYSTRSLFRSVEEGDGLAERLCDTVEQSTWSIFGGAGAAIYFAPTRHLVVYQTERVHAAVEQFLAGAASTRDNPSQ